MVESFYAALGVEADADREAVRAAYRERVKEHHPDVSDDPSAAGRFKRLTTSREVLLDPDERERYDSLGHARYVDRFVEAPAWTGTDGPAGDGGTDGGRSDRRGTDGRESDEKGANADAGPAGEARTATADRMSWLGGSGPSGPSTTGTSRRRRRGRRRHVRHPAGGDDTWGTASATYRRSAAASAAAANRGSGGVARLLTGVGPWIAVHVVFLASAVATGWFTLVEANRYLNLSLSALVVCLLLFGLVVTLSVLHVISQVFA